MEKLISVIVPIFNSEKYLSDMLNSVMKQTYENLEILLINDGSRDGSGQICDEYALRDKRIRVIHKENTGIGNTRNIGLEVATGEYMYFIDADDYLDADAIKTLYEEMKKIKVDTVIGGYIRVNENKKMKNVCSYEPVVYRGEAVREKCLARIIGSDVTVKDSLKPSVWNTLYSADIIKKHNIFFADEKNMIAEDLFFNMIYFCHSKSVLISEHCNYFYRQNEASFTAKHYKSTLLEQSIAMNLFEENFLREAGLYEIMKYRLMRQFFIRLKSCLQQENTRVSGKRFGEAVQSMKLLLKNDYVQKQLKAYPIRNTGWKQQVFLILCKYEVVYLLYALL